MAAGIPEHFRTVAPSEADMRMARESSRILAAHPVGKRASVRIRLDEEGEPKDPVDLPVSVLRLLHDALAEMAQGHAVTLIPSNAELTTQQAADLLNVSRPYVVKLLDERKIPSRMVGKYRRIRFDDLMAYKRQDDDRREQILDELAAETQRLGIGY